MNGLRPKRSDQRAEEGRADQLCRIEGDADQRRVAGGEVGFVRLLMPSETGTSRPAAYEAQRRTNVPPSAKRSCAVGSAAGREDRVERRLARALSTIRLGSCAGKQSGRHGHAGSLRGVSPAGGTACGWANRARWRWLGVRSWRQSPLRGGSAGMLGLRLTCAASDAPSFEPAVMQHHDRTCRASCGGVARRAGGGALVAGGSFRRREQHDRRLAERRAARACTRSATDRGTY